MSLSNYGEALALDAEFSAARYLGLFTTTPGESSAGVEVAGGSYARIRIDLLMGAAVQGAPSTKTNTGLLTFPRATADWAPGGAGAFVVGWATFDALAAGNLIRYGTIKDATLAVDTPRVVLNGDLFEFAIGAFVAKMD